MRYQRTDQLPISLTISKITHLLSQHGSARGHQGVGTVEAVKGELHARTHAEKAALAGEGFLVVAAAGVVRACVEMSVDGVE